jgi:hypothetical protein
MAMQYDVKAGWVNNTSGSVYGGPARVKGVAYSYSTDATFNIRDGGASGPIVWSFTAPDNNGSIYMLFPGEGIKCNTSIYVDIPSGHVTVFYG